MTSSGQSIDLYTFSGRMRPSSSTPAATSETSAIGCPAKNSPTVTSVTARLFLSKMRCTLGFARRGVRDEV